MNGFATKILLPLAMLGTLAAPLAAQEPPVGAGGMGAGETVQMRPGPAVPGPQRPIPPAAMLPAAMPPAGMPPAAISGLGLAAHLAGAGIWLDITDAQQDAWHDYCQALIAFVAPDMRAPSDVAPDAARSDAPDNALRPLPAERMAGQALARAETARTLLDAAAALRDVLEPAQIDRLAQIGPVFGPGPRGAHGQHGPDMRP